MIDLTNLLLSAITILLGVIGFFMVKLYDRFEALVKDFHHANSIIARHDERIRALEQ